MGRSPCCDKANVKRGPWSPEEDAALRSYLERHGTGGNWIALPQKAGLKRCGKSCRLRWLNYLRPDIKHGGFTEEEDNIICTLFNNIGSRWSVIASQLPGRTDNDVKNHWNTKLKKRVMAGSGQQTTIHSPLPPTPPAPPPLIPAIKAEDLPMPFDSSFGFTQEYCRYFSELPPFPMPGLINQPEFMNGFVVIPPEESSAASSSVENWSANGSSGDDAFLPEHGFESYSEFLSGYGEIAPFYPSNLATKPHGLYQRVTYS